MREELGKIKTALHLMNSMILSGEEHSSASTLALTQAALAIEQLEARPEAAQVRVKALAWNFWNKHGEHEHGVAVAGADADTVLGKYRIVSYKGISESRVFLGAVLIFEGDYTDCKPAAQADFDRRIRAALEPDTVTEANDE